MKTCDNCKDRKQSLLHPYNVYIEPDKADNQPSEIIFAGIYKAVSASWLCAELNKRKLPKGKKFTYIAI